MEVVTRALKDGSAQVWFSGSDTYANKDHIQVLGYKFGEMNFDCIVTVVVERVYGRSPNIQRRSNSHYWINSIDRRYRCSHVWESGINELEKGRNKGAASICSCVFTLCAITLRRVGRA